jgi:hypothetical protein
MTTYATAAAFKQALETRLRASSATGANFARRRQNARALSKWPAMRGDASVCSAHQPYRKRHHHGGAKARGKIDTARSGGDHRFIEFRKIAVSFTLTRSAASSDPQLAGAHQPPILVCHPCQLRMAMVADPNQVRRAMAMVVAPSAYMLGSR